MTEKEVLKETDEWIERLKDLLTRTKNREHVFKHIKLLERLKAMAEKQSE